MSRGEGVALLLTALALRLAAAWTLGEGAPFGPDGTGVEAAVHLGGHLYPGHVALIAMLGSARTVSILCGSLSCLVLWAFGKRLGLGGSGGWLAAFLPLAVLPSALAAGDAPALLVVLLGALLATGPGWILPLAGGALAMSSVVVKPIALPALVLLLARPRSLLGMLLALPLVATWLRPLWRPMPRGGLLGTWWQASEGAPPAGLQGWLALVLDGLLALADQPLWVFTPLLLVALGAWLRNQRALDLACVGPLVAVWAVAALLGERLEARYLGAAMVAALPWAGAVLPAFLAPLLLPLSVAVITQVGAERAARDPTARVPAVPVLSWPPVDAAAIFEDSSTDGATALRQRAAELAEELPRGATVTVQRRPHGREGELLWPLKVARPDLRFELVPPGTPGAW